jgi:CRP/FNR family transcriptional regulator, nitrogen fixation regulation protein
MPAAVALNAASIRATRPVSSAPTDELVALDRLGTVVTLRREQPLFHEADSAEFYFKVISGAVRSCKLLADGRRHVGEFFLPGDFIGLDAEDAYIFTAEAVTETVVVRYARRSVDNLAFQEPRISRRLMRIACRNLSAAQHQMLLLSRKTAEERIASFILAMAERNGDSDRITLPMTRTDIGDHLGLTMETVSRALTQLRKEGVIELKNSHDVVIRDRDMLADLAEAA